MLKKSLQVADLACRLWKIKSTKSLEANMRGKADTQVTMLTLITADQLVPEDHPIRQIKPIVDKALIELSPTFNRMYAETGRRSIPPEHLLKACLLIALYSVRSERQFCERLHYDLLFKWFLDLNIKFSLN